MKSTDQIDDDLKSLNSQAQQSESKRSKKSKNDADKETKEAIDNKKRLKVIKDAHRDLKSKFDAMSEQYTKLKEQHSEQEGKLKESEAQNEELKCENAKLYDNILILQQKITDELGAQMQNESPIKATADDMQADLSSDTPQRALSLKDVSLVSDIKKTQGQGGGLAKKKADGASKASASKLTEEELRLQEAKEEDELREQMEASNKIAQALVQSEQESKKYQDQLKAQEDELAALKLDMTRLRTDYVAKEKEMNHFKELYEDSYE